jgi:hypothetical protein
MHGRLRRYPQPINDRRWPHFVGFSIVSKMRAKIPEKFRRRELARSFAISANHGGIPVRLPPNYWEELISRLKAADETSALALPG